MEDAGPLPNRGRRLFLSQLASHRTGNPYSCEEARQHVLVADLYEIVQRGRIGYDDRHLRAKRAAERSFAASS
jgi:hypothetical protein